MTPDVAFEILASPLAVSLEAFLTIVSAARGETDLVAAFNPQGTPSKSTRAAGVAVVPVQGLLTLRGTTWGNSYNQIQNWLRQVAEDQQVEQIVLDVDSPGGAVSGAEETSEVVAYAASRKPVIAVSNGMMASASYWVSSAATEIVASPSSSLGSVGVYAIYNDVSRAREMAASKQTIVAAGKFKAESAGGPLTDEAQVAMQQIVDDAYTLFVRRVSRGRRTSEAAVRSGYGQGRVLTSQRAVEAGLADRVGTLESVLGWAGADGKSTPASGLTRRGATGPPVDLAAELRRLELQFAEQDQLFYERLVLDNLSREANGK